MNLIKFVAFLLSISLLGGCSSSKQHSDHIKQIDYRSPVAISPNLSITVPEGWREIDDNKNKIFDIWLLNKENNASIGFIPIHLDNRFNLKDDRDKHKLVVDFMLSKKRSASADFEVINIEDQYSENEHTSLTYMNEDKLQKSIIFGRGNIFYECIAFSDLNVELSEEEIEEMFRIQREVVTSSKIK